MSIPSCTRRQSGSNDQIVLIKPFSCPSQAWKCSLEIKYWNFNRSVFSKAKHLWMNVCKLYVQLWQVLVDASECLQISLWVVFWYNQNGHLCKFSLCMLTCDTSHWSAGWSDCLSNLHVATWTSSAVFVRFSWNCVCISCFIFSVFLGWTYCKLNRSEDTAWALLMFLLETIQ